MHAMCSQEERSGESALQAAQLPSFTDVLFALQLMLSPSTPLQHVALKTSPKEGGEKVQEKTHTSWLQACIIVVQFPPSNLICQSHWGSSRGKQATQTAATSQDYKWEAERKITLIFIPLWTLAEKDLSRRSFWKRYPAPRQLWHHLLVSQGLLFNICYLWSGSHCPLVHPVLAVDAHTEGDGG